MRFRYCTNNVIRSKRRKTCKSRNSKTLTKNKRTLRSKTWSVPRTATSKSMRPRSEPWSKPCNKNRSSYRASSTNQNCHLTSKPNSWSTSTLKSDIWIKSVHCSWMSAEPTTKMNSIPNWEKLKGNRSWKLVEMMPLWGRWGKNSLTKPWNWKEWPRRWDQQLIRMRPSCRFWGEKRSCSGRKSIRSKLNIRRPWGRKGINSKRWLICKSRICRMPTPTTPTP